MWLPHPPRFREGGTLTLSASEPLRILWVRNPKPFPHTMELPMTRTRLLLPLALVAILLLPATPAFGVSKEIVQLQTQVQALQDQMTQMRQSFDERMGVMKNLIEQSTDNVNKVAASVNELTQQLQKSHNDTGARADQLSGQIQALNDSV